MMACITHGDFNCLPCERNELRARVAELEAENKSLIEDRVSEDMPVYRESTMKSMIADFTKVVAEREAAQQRIVELEAALDRRDESHAILVAQERTRGDEAVAVVYRQNARIAELEAKLRTCESALAQSEATVADMGRELVSAVNERNAARNERDEARAALMREREAKRDGEG